MTSHQLLFFVSGVVGFGPSIAVLYHALRTYDYPHTDHAYFESRRVFLGIAVGMVLGTVSGGLAVALAAPDLLALVLVLALLALFEEGFKLVYLNRKGYRGRYDTTFYGVAIGIGMSALVAAGTAYVNGPGLFAPGRITLVAVFSASLAFIHAATGAVLGFGCSRGDLLPAFVQAYAARVLHAAMLIPFFVWSTTGRTDIAIPLFSLAAATAFTVVVYWYAYGSVLPNTLPPEMRRERRRSFRKATGGDE
ncbi:MAG: hypothetical protein HY557_01120 [Euryarchaeota archaeon]|nr:hypothetical protein [Euryarchaeota archaeon]